jgi:hypothetical protein
MNEPARGIGLLLKNRPSPALIPETTDRASDAWSPTAPAPVAAASWEPEAARGEGWPATVLHRLPRERRAAVRVAAPILRQLQAIDGLRLVHGATGGELLIRATDARAGDRVLLGAQDGQLVVDGYLSADAYSRQVSRCIQRLLAEEAAPHTQIDAIRAARRRLESWLGLPEDPRNPWALPGDLSDGTLYLSRRILDWCGQRVEAPATRWLDGGLPDVESWGPGPLTFATVREAGGGFTSILISEDEHAALSDSWRRLMTAEEAPGLPEVIQVLLRQLSIPSPALPLPEHLSVLAAWSGAPAPALARRAQAMLLLSLATAPAQRSSLRGLGLIDRQLEGLHRQWTDAGCPADALPGIVTDDELPAALSAMAGQPGDTMVARLEALVEQRLTGTAAVADLIAQSQALTDEVATLRAQSEALKAHRSKARAALDALERRVSAFAPLLEDSAPIAELPTRPATVEAFRAELDARAPGLSPAAADRLLLAITAAQDLGAPVLLIGPECAEVAAALPDIFDGAGRHHVPVRPEWSGEADLLGHVAKDRFIASGFTEAIQQATVHAVQAARATPGFVWLEGMDRADTRRYTPSLLAAMERDRRITLYPRAQHAAWMASGAVSEPGGWQLALPPGLVILGTLEGHSELPESLTERSLMMRLPAPDLAAALSFSGSGGTSRLELPDQPARDARAAFPRAWDNLLSALEILRPLGLRPSRRLGRQAAAILGRAASWGMTDGEEVSAHLVHLLLLGRLQHISSTGPLCELLKCDWLTEELSEAIQALID